jgi:steroid delta-isomerase
METLQALTQARRDHPDSFDAGSASESAALERFTAFFSSLAPDRVASLLDATYAPDVFFDDTLKSVRGSAALKTYLSHSADAVEQCRVWIEETTRTQEGEYLVRWRMMIRFKRFRRGVDTWTIGISHLRFASDGRVVYHQDYWNAAAGLFQHLPVIGAVIRWIQRRL